MSLFLPAGIISDNVSDLAEKIAELRAYYEQGDMIRLKASLHDLEEMILEMAVFLETLSCQPLIYTGKGSTDEVIKRLEWALTQVEENSAADIIQQNQERKKKGNK
ncbi:MAG: hypothetical protein ABFD08_17315 [Syntrophomonas sp.]